MLTGRWILVVEDNKINRMTLCNLLSESYKTLEAANGREALSILENRGEEISLILLDIVMPVMDGYTFLAAMKTNPAFASIPVIVTTQSDSEADEVAALSHGATDFVAKPYKPEIILHRVASMIRLRETAAMVNQFQYDQLTGLYSKAFFYQRVREVLRQHPQRKYDIICSDIENFKLINDVFGVPAGDQLLRDVADMYLKTAGEKGICGRIHADQFACLLKHRDEYTDEMFMQTISAVNERSNARNIVMKWGIYAIDSRELPVEQMCDRALLAARSIKGQYGKYFAAYDDALRSKLLREQDIIDHMETALAEGQFQIYLQPKYQILGNVLAGAEALVRWDHPRWGMQSPAEFIPIFEKNGFITRLDQFVWEKSCELLRKWDDGGLPCIPVSVNVSRADIYHANIADILLKTVRKYGLDPSRLHLEITESAYTEDPDQIIETVRHLRELGFIIEMDDFGSGYSSLNMLNQMPIDILKLDMRFIQSETAKPMDQGILRFIMELARWMGLRVVAEGVETQEQLDRLIEVACDYVQGYYFSKPLPCVEMEALLAKTKNAAGQESRERVLSPRRVLLVADEDGRYREQAREALEGIFQILEAATVQAALDALEEHGAQIAAVLLSSSLPEPDGFAVLDRAKQIRKAGRLPVIMTGPPDPKLEEHALEQGAEEYADKPHTSKTLRKRTLRVMEKSSSREWELALQEACRDYQTGLLNRRGFDAAMGALKEEDMPVALCLFDLDNLKQINDTCGHVEGDRLIESFASLLKTHTRERDILARFGGDEFVVVMKRMRSEEAALKKGREICDAFRKKKFAGEMASSCTGGIAFCQSGDLVTEKIVQADRALYHEKADGKGSCRLWRG